MGTSFSITAHLLVIVAFPTRVFHNTSYQGSCTHILSMTLANKNLERLFFRTISPTSKTWVFSCGTRRQTCKFGSTNLVSHTCIFDSLLVVIQICVNRPNLRRCVSYKRLSLKNLKFATKICHHLTNISIIC